MADAEDNAEGQGKQSWCYTKICGYSLILLTGFLSMLEPSCLSKHALSAVQQRGQRRQSQDNLCRLLQFSVGLSGSWSATGALKFVKNLRSYFVAMYLARGKRGLGLVLSWSMDWPSVGIYRLVPVVGKKLFMHQPWTNVTVQVSAEVIKKVGGPLSEMHIEYNWSETEAVLKGQRDSHLCILILGEHVVAQHYMDTFNDEMIPFVADQPASNEDAVGEDGVQEGACKTEEALASEHEDDDVLVDDESIRKALLASSTLEDGYAKVEQQADGDVKLEDKGVDERAGNDGQADQRAEAVNPQEHHDTYDESQMSFEHGGDHE